LLTKIGITSTRPRVFLDQRTLAADENEMGALAAFWAPLLQAYGRLSLFEVVTLEAGYCSLHNAPSSTRPALGMS
jgi:hypothetical protein